MRIVITGTALSVAAAMASTAAIVLLASVNAPAQNEISYDPEKGIVIVDKKNPSKKDGNAEPLVSFEKQQKKESAVTAVPQPRDSMDLQAGRKKDPSTLYFLSGIEYYKNADYPHALHNFIYADSIDHRPVYRLWVGKTLRQLGEPQKMLATLRELIQRHPESDVADDALFEIAYYYQSCDDYEAASRTYTQLAEQYPFGESYSTGEKFIDVARECRKNMLAQLGNMLAITGYRDDDCILALKAFQNDHGLAATGLADQTTVSAIKKSLQKVFERERQKNENRIQAERYQWWILLAGLAGFLNLLVVIRLFFGIRAKQRHLGELRENVAAFMGRNV